MLWGKVSILVNLQGRKKEELGDSALGFPAAERTFREYKNDTQIQE
jgi:hypothetical protein